MGLLGGITNPEFLQAIEEQTAIAQRVADCYGCSIETASAALLQLDIYLSQLFAAGGSHPRELLN